MPLEIIGAGFGRTGTVSLSKAIDILYSPQKCYHFIEIWKNPNHPAKWTQILTGVKNQKIDWNDIFGENKYVATMDHPCCDYFEDLMNQYPQAKIILSEHPGGEDAWLLSRITLEELNLMLFTWPIRPLSQIIFWIINKLWKTSIPPTVQISDFEKLLDLIDGPIYGPFRNRNRDQYIQRYRNRIAKVQEIVPESRLLKFKATDGWEPLCAFLGKPIPALPFPKEDYHGTKNIQKLVRYIKIGVWTFYGFWLVGIAWFIYYLCF